MDAIRYLISLSACVFFLASAFGASPPHVKTIEPPDSILFVGNSFIYYNNSLHNHVRNLMRDNDQPVEVVRAMTISGARLAAHLPAIDAQLESRDWDIVVLQGNSMEAIDPEMVPGFQRAATELAHRIHQSGAIPVFFMTWARTDQPGQTTVLDDAYTGIGNDTHALVVPVGLAFATASEQLPGVALRIADRRHPTVAGSYLAACTFYAAFFRDASIGNGYTAGLDADIAKSLQQIAQETVADYYAR